MRLARSFQLAVTCVTFGSYARAFWSARWIISIFRVSESASGAGDLSTNGGLALLATNFCAALAVPPRAMKDATSAAFLRFSIV